MGKSPANSPQMMFPTLGNGNLGMIVKSVRVVDCLPRAKAPWINIRVLLHPSVFDKRPA